MPESVFPGARDTFTVITSATPPNAATGISHAAVETKQNEAIAALQAKLQETSTAASPEGARVAGPGSLYWQVGIGLWAKNTGTGNTGWILILTL